MPAKSKKQRRFMGAELSRARAGKKTQTGMSEDKLSEFVSKSIDVYLFKHGHVLPCGHHAEEGADIDKACTSGGCGAMGGTSITPYRESGTNTGRSGTVYAPSTDNVPSGIHLPSGGSGSSGGATGSGTMTSSSPPEGGFRRSADSIKLINRYLNKQSRHKCGHKKGDPNHLEAA